MFQIFRTATILFGLLTIITGVAYPLAVTAIAQMVFPHAANGSLIEKPGASLPAHLHTNPRDWRSDSSTPVEWVGSDLIGQPFAAPQYFWGRPSATGPVAYNGLGGSGSNQATTNPALEDAVRDRVAKLQAADPENKALVPIDLVTASASGLDPHISEAAALYQAQRVARVRNIDPYTVNKLVLSHTLRPTVGVFGQTRVNVLRLNMALDALEHDSTIGAKASNKQVE